MLIAGGRSSRYPFTTSQWQELEHQALIFKYMMSGLPVPPELIIPIRRSLFMDSATLPFFPPPPPPPPPLGWGAHQMGYGRKAEDPEPGRCRRTDGKKWRCSKEAYPDSKYCERHMHRGKSRSRKLVELSLATSSASAHEFPAKDLLLPPPPPPLSLSFSCSSSSRFPPATGFSHPGNPANFSLPSSVPHSVDTYRNFLGFKENINEFPFFSDIKGAAREAPCGQPPGSFDHKQGGGAHLRSGLPEKKDQRCFVMGSDLRSEKEEEEEEERQKLGPFHCFFDEPPQGKKAASWTSSSDDDRAQQDSFSKTQLSISMPAASRETPAKASHCYSGPNLAT